MASFPNLTSDPWDDLHLLRGQTLFLSNLIRVGDDPISVYSNENSDLEFLYIPFFQYDTGGDSDDISGCNINMNTANGNIEALATPNNPEIYNFLVHVMAKHDGVRVGETFIRVHVHRAVEEIWLTPSTLTVQSGMKNFRFTVHARFDDGVIGEIGGIGSQNFIVYDVLFPLTWSHPISNFVDPVTGVIDPSKVTHPGEVADPVTVTLTISNPATQLTATAKVIISNDLSASNTANTAVLVSSGNCPGFDEANDVPNVLFMADGFTEEYESNFDSMVDNYVAQLIKGKITSPFDLLSGSINYWKVFIPSREYGVTTRAQIYLTQEEDSDDVFGEKLDGALKPLDSDLQNNDDASTWSHQHLFYHVGLPIPGDEDKDPDDLIKAWKAITLVDPDDIDKFGAKTIEAWQKAAQRRIPEEKDTLFGLFVDNYSESFYRPEAGVIQFNGFKRMQRSELDNFLNALKDEDDNMIGRYFASTVNLNGKDMRRLIILSAGSIGRANTRTTGVITIVNDFKNHFAIDGNTIPKSKASVNYESDIEDLSVEQKAAITHELGHTFALEDEYGEPPPDGSEIEGKFINDPSPLVRDWPFTVYTGSDNGFDSSANVQTRGDLLSLNPNVPGQSILDATKLKWRYHRITAAGVVVKPLVETDDAEYSITIDKDASFNFSENDIVFLRKRLLYDVRIEFISQGNRQEAFVLMITPEQIVAPAVKVLNVGSENMVLNDPVNNVQYTVVLTTTSALTNFSAGQDVTIMRSIMYEPIYTITREVSPQPGVVSQIITLSISQELKITDIDNGSGEISASTVDGQKLSDDFIQAMIGKQILLYKPMAAPDSVKTAIYKYAEVLPKKVMDYLVDKPYAFNAKPDPSNGNAITEIIDDKAIQNSSIPGSLVPCCSRQKKRIVAIYSGGNQDHGNIYHPTGQCFMRDEYHREEDGNKMVLDEFCIVCKYALVNMIDGNKHGDLNKKYSDKIYPT